MNKPIVYDKFNTSWNEPLAVLHNAYNVKIREKLKGEYKLTLNSPLDSKCEHIKRENYIEVDGEIFKITKDVIPRNEDGSIIYEIEAEHVFYEMLDDYIPTTTELLEATPQDVVNIISQYTNFTFTVEGAFEVKYFIVERGNPISVINKMIETWDIELHRNRRNTNIKIAVNAEKIQLFKWGKNIKTLRRTGSSEATTTRLYVIGKDGLTVEGLDVTTIPYYMELDGAMAFFYNNSTDMVLQFIAETQLVGSTRVLKYMYIDSKYIANYPRPKCGEHKVNSEDQLEILLEGLKELQKTEQEVENFEMSAVELSKIKGDLEKFGLGWTALIQEKDILKDKVNHMIQARIIEYEHYPYDLNDSIVKIGYFNDNVLDFLTKLRETKNKVDDKADSWDKIYDMIDDTGTISAQWLNDRIASAGDMIKFGTGNVIGDSRGLMVLDTDSIDTAMAIIILTTSSGKPIVGIASRTNTTENFVYRTALDSDGINADEIVTGVLKTSLVSIVGNPDIPNAFVWNENGLKVHKINPDNTVDITQYIILDNQGLRFTKDNGVTWSINIGFDSDNVATKDDLLDNKVYFQYSIDNVNWHDTFTDGDIYIRQKVGSEPWSEGIRIRGEQGIQGPTGTDGQTYYTWIKYADDINGTNMSDSPLNKEYIGIAYNKTTAIESNDPNDYTWSKFKGDLGIQGPTGADGTDGQTFYTWIKYATGPNGEGMSNDPTGKTYLGIAYNKTTQLESTNPSDYTWSKTEGPAPDTSQFAPKISEDGLLDITNTQGIISYKDSLKEEYTQLYAGGLYRVMKDSQNQDITKEYFFERHIEIAGTRQGKKYTAWGVDESVFMTDLNPIHLIQLPDYFKGRNFKVFAEMYLGDGDAILDLAINQGNSSSTHTSVCQILTEDETQTWDGYTLETMPQSIKDTGRFKVKCYLYWEYGWDGGSWKTYVTRERVKIDALV